MYISKPTPFCIPSTTRVVEQQHIDHAHDLAPLSLREEEAKWSLKLEQCAYHREYFDGLKQQGLQDPVVEKLGNIFRAYEQLYCQREEIEKTWLHIQASTTQIYTLFVMCVFSLLLHCSARLFFPRYPVYISGLTLHAYFTASIVGALALSIFNHCKSAKGWHVQQKGYQSGLNALIIQREQVQKAWESARALPQRHNLVFSWMSGSKKTMLAFSSLSFAGRISEKNCI